MEIYERIKYLRKTILNMTQENFGAALGANRNVINNIEQNRLARPEQKKPLYKLICKEFNISYEWLTTGIGDMLAVPKNDTKAALMQQIIDTYKFDELDQKWLSILFELEPEERKALREIALLLAQKFTSNNTEVQKITADKDEEYRAEWNKNLTEEEAVALVRQRYADSKKGELSSTISENPEIKEAESA